MYDGLPVDRLSSDFAEVMGSAYSVSAFTDWVDPGVMVWRKQRAGAPTEPEWLGARVADGPRHPIKGMPADYATQQGGVPGPWNERLPHFRLDFTPSNGDELQSEYFVPRERSAEAFEALRVLGNQLAPVLQVSEVRTIAADDLWLSGAYGGDAVGLHFTWVRDVPGVYAVLPRIEDALLPLGARPHWGKCFLATAARLAPAYPRFDDFRRLADRLDPGRKLRNEFLERHLGLAC